ncbi:MAG: aldo/keto reductase [Bacteroidota bacterium]
MTSLLLPRTDIAVSPITFGAWAIGGWLWGGNERADSLASIQAALDHGISSFDTAPVYGFGLSEELVGEALKGKRQQVQILTKFGLSWGGASGHPHSQTTDPDGTRHTVVRNARRDTVIAECEASLKRLQTDYIDLYQLHWPDPSTPIDDTLEALDRLLEQGKIRAAGLCNASAELMEQAEALLPMVSNQVPYSMVERGIEAEVVPQALKVPYGILAYSPLQRGLLTGKIKPDHKFAPGDHRPRTPHFQPAKLAQVNAILDQLRPIAADHNATLAQLVIHWTLQQPGITVALVGARNAKQAAENAAACELEVKEEVMGKVQGLVEEMV